MNTDRIYLTGFMGSGKSTVAPRLARGLGYEEVDLDVEIVRSTGLSIPAIFELYGEDRFRQEEHDMLRRTSERTGIVVSLGGGTIIDQDNLAWCREHGTLVYLQGSAAFLASRLAVSRRERPLLYDSEGEQLPMVALRERVADLLAQRAPIYEQADVVVGIDAVSVGKVVASIRKKLGI